jgi:hypothetical protein
MMLKIGKTPAEAAKIARDFVQFVFDDSFPENLSVHGILVKLNKKTGEISMVYDSKQDADPAISSTTCSGYRMAIEFNDKLYFVSLGHPSMFLLEVDPQEDGTDDCNIAFKRSLSTDGQKAQIAAGVHGLIEYDGELLMCFADEASDVSRLNLEGNPTYSEGGLIVASKDGRNWRAIATEDDFNKYGATAYHSYDGLFGGGVWDIIEYNGHVYVTVVTDLLNLQTQSINKQGFAMYRGTKQGNGDFTWEMVIGEMEEDGVSYPYGLGCDYSMACNLWVYDGYLYLGTYNDPMCDLAEVPAHANFAPLYWDLYYSVMLYRMDGSENIELVGGRTSDIFPNRLGNLGNGLGDNSNQYVWRMVEHDSAL